MPRVLVAGATGYLGSYVVREFKRRGWRVRALARNPGKLAPIRSEIDEVLVGEITQPDTLARACDGVDVVFSSVGMTKQKGKLSFRDVDYQGNKNLLDVAQRAGAKKYIYTSVFNGRKNEHLALVKAHEDFVRVLEASGIDYAVIRPTGYFSDMGEFFKMAQHGRVVLFGSGDARINPIDGADLASVCADAADNPAKEVEVGGPAIMSYTEIATIAFEALGKEVKISRLPVWLTRFAVCITKLFSQRTGEVLAFLTAMALEDLVAPQLGVCTLREHYAKLAAKEPKQLGTKRRT